MTPVDDEVAAATWAKKVSASTIAHGEPNIDSIKRPIFVPILIAGDARANGMDRESSRVKQQEVLA